MKIKCTNGAVVKLSVKIGDKIRSSICGTGVVERIIKPKRGTRVCTSPALFVRWYGFTKGTSIVDITCATHLNGSSVYTQIN